jgi:regulatory protein
MKLLEIKQKKKYALLITEENQTILTDPAYPGNQGFALEEEIDTEQCLRDNADFACTYGFDAALTYLSYAARTEHQIEEYLEKKHLTADCIRAVMRKLKDYRFADDAEYAKIFISDAAAQRKGRRLIERKLKEKGIGKTEIQNALQTYPRENEEENLRQFLHKQNELLKKYPPRVRKEKMYRKAVTQGYDSAMISATMPSECFEDGEDDRDEYDAYFSVRVEKQCLRHLKKGLSEEEAKTKLYGIFLPQGASKVLIDTCVATLYNAE